MLEPAGIAGFITEDVMAAKCGELHLNLGDVVETVPGRNADRAPFVERLRAEERGVLAAAGIAFVEVGSHDPRRGRLLDMVDIPGVTRIGRASTQSLACGAGRIDSDCLDGEIALIARRHGIDPPANAWAARLGAARAPVP